MKLTTLPLEELATALAGVDTARGTWSLHAVGGATGPDDRERVVELASGGGHPYETLVGMHAPPGCHTLLLSTGTASAAMGAAPLLPAPGVPDPAAPLVLAVARPGGASRYLEFDGTRAVESHAYADGLLADALRRVLGVDASAPEFPVGFVLARMWLSIAVQASDAGLAVGPDDLHAMDPLPAALSTAATAAGMSRGALAELTATRNTPDAPDWAAAPLVALVGRMPWAAVADGLDDGMSDAVAAWCGPHLRVKLAFSALPPADQLAAHLRRRHPHAADRAVSQLIARGWWEGDP